MNNNALLRPGNWIIISLVVVALIIAGIWYYKVRHDLDLEYSHLVEGEWSLNDVQEFIESLPKTDLKELGDLTGESGATAEQLTNHLMWLSSYAFTYPFKDKNNVDYQSEILLWAAQENGITLSGSPSTFRVERKILEKKFVQVWDRLTPQQRNELLKKDEFSGLNDNQKTALVAGTGAAALTALSATVAFSGFTFYTSMSTVIATSAGLLGVTLPFSVYTGASSAVAVLTGPIGWTLALVAGTGAAIWASAPDVDKTSAFILALHVYKAKRAEEIAMMIQRLGGEVDVI